MYSQSRTRPKWSTRTTPCTWVAAAAVIFPWPAATGELAAGTETITAARTAGTATGSQLRGDLMPDPFAGMVVTRNLAENILRSAQDEEGSALAKASLAARRSRPECRV